MSGSERLKGPTRHGFSMAVFTGNFATLQEFLLEKESFFWGILRLFDYLLRGFGQVVCANNPISGLLITISLAATAPSTLLFSSLTGFLGLLLSMMIRDSQKNIINGVTVLNPLLVGAISSTLIPKIYGRLDAFGLLLVILGTIFSVYLGKSMENNKRPYIAWPFNLTEFVLLFVLHTQDNGLDTMEKLQPGERVDNATSDATTGNVSFIAENTRDHIDWGMVFHGVIVSASQTFAVENVVTGSVIYLAALLFSPKTASFAFLGALIGSLAGLMFGVPINEIYSGLWGYNSFLTGAALAGTFFVLSGQTAAATVVAIIYTTAIQYSILFFFRNLKLPVISLPFVLVTTLFMKLGNNPVDDTSLQTSQISVCKKPQTCVATEQLLAHKVSDPERC